MRKIETPVQVDGKIVAVVPGNIIHAVCIPGKLVNLLTGVRHRKKPFITLHCEEGIKKGKPFKRYRVNGKLVKLGLT